MTDASGSSQAVLEVQGLRTEFRIGKQWLAAVRGISLSVARGETVALVGESGSGKSVSALSVMRLLPQHGARAAGGKVRLDGHDLLALSETQMLRKRGSEIAMIFQEPMSSLNPTMRIGDQIAESVRMHRQVSRDDARRQALQMLTEVRIPDAAARFNDYPHQFSGGMRQRAMIAMALVCHPKMLLADEPTTALDVTVQAQILTLLADLQARYEMGVLFITHNLGVVAQIADRVAVMYAGEIVELARTMELFERPTHPYTEALLRTIPRVDRDRDSLRAIPGSVPSIAAMPSGCAFAPRCPLRQPQCAQHPVLAAVPGTAKARGEHWVRCPVRVEAIERGMPNSLERAS